MPYDLICVGSEIVDNVVSQKKQNKKPGSISDIMYSFGGQTKKSPEEKNSITNH